MAKAEPIALPEVAQQADPAKPTPPLPEKAAAKLPFDVPKGATVEDLGGGTYMVKA